MLSNLTASKMTSRMICLHDVVNFGVFYLSAVVFLHGHMSASELTNTFQAHGAIVHRNTRPQDGNLNIIMTFVDKSLEHCIRECQRRSSCKAVEYRRLLHWCRLRSDISTVVTSKGFVTVTGFDGTGTCGNMNCSSVESCNETTQMCAIKACGSPDRGHETRGNRFEVGSKVFRNCVDGIQQLICTNEGQWMGSNLLITHSELTCSGLKQRDPKIRSGVYKNQLAMHIYCDFDTDGESWMVFQRRMDGSVDFFRNWYEYKTGFGDKCGEFWFGLEHLYTLILSSGKQFRLRIDMEDWYGNTRYAVYEDFFIADESDAYRLNCGTYSGTAGDALRGVPRHDGQKFSTMDRDNDLAVTNCALAFKGAWWYEKCHIANLNGKYHDNNTVPEYAEGIVWKPWTTYFKSLRKTTMKIQEAFVLS